ncbi:MAG: hypothetical protein ABSG87_05805 [Verrucomicrobiota bacterium]|jgi:hypothetical protein
MDKSDLLKIAFAAIIAVVFKELLTWLISKSKPIATMAAKISGQWILRHIFAIELVIDIGLLVLFVEIFNKYPSNETVVTYSTVRIQIMLGVLIAIQILTVVKSFKRWIAYKKHLDF